MVDLKGLNSPLVRYGALIIVWILWYALFYMDISEKIEAQNSSINALKIKLSTIAKEKKRLQDQTKELNRLNSRLSSLKSRLLTGENGQIVASKLQDMLIQYMEKNKIDVLTYKTSSEGRRYSYNVARATFTLKCNRENFVALLSFFKDNHKLIRPYRLNVIWIKGKKAHLRVVLDVEAIYIKPESA